MIHTKEPWDINHINSTEVDIIGPPDNGACDIIGTMRTSDAILAVECVNACAGLNPAAIPGVVDAAIRLADDVQDLIDGSKDCGDPGCECPMQDAYNPDSTLERLNDLLRALAKLQVQS